MEMKANSAEALMNEHEVALRAGVSVGTLKRRRLLKLPPAFVKLGASVRYKPSEVTAWINACVAQPEGK